MCLSTSACVWNRGCGAGEQIYMPDSIVHTRGGRFTAKRIHVANYVELAGVWRDLPQQFWGRVAIDAAEVRRPRRGRRWVVLTGSGWVGIRCNRLIFGCLRCDQEGL